MDDLRTGGRRPAYNLQSVDSLPQPRREPGSDAFVTGGAYALLFLFGALQALVGSFQFSRTIGAFPWVAAGLAVVIGVTCLAGAAGMGSLAGALVPAIGWFGVSVALTVPTSGGSVIVTSTAAGELYLYGGSVCAAAGVLLAVLRRGRQRDGRPGRATLPRHQNS